MDQRSSSSPSSSLAYSFHLENRSRRSHQKSRNGCLTCKQRRKKCDEQRPSCTPCERSLRTCVYSADQRSPGQSQSNATSKSLVPSAISSLSRPFDGLLARSRGPFSGFSMPICALSQVRTNNTVPYFTDAELYFHFLNHTCKFARLWHKDRIVLQVGIAKLALDSELVSHSVLALSAACLCRDTISNGSADPQIIRQLLDLGLQHHTLALEKMRTTASCPKESDIQPLLASALLMVPFALSFQHIHHWVLFAEGLQDIDLLTPRDAVLLLRGIGTTVIALNSYPADVGSRKPKTPCDTMFSAQNTDSEDFTAIPEYSHTMFPVLAATFRQALSQLQRRIESGLATHQTDEISASVFDAYNILNDIMSSTFLDFEKVEISLGYVTYFSVAPDSLLAQAPGWLQNFVLRRPRTAHTEPLARSLLAFFSSVSKTYIDLLLPLLDSRTNNVDDDPELTTTEVLALDVYAHWLVLMLLVENEAWWVGDFPFVALQGLIARYGDKFWGTCLMKEHWWPAKMLEVAARFK